MRYVEGFVLAVPTENQQAFRQHADKVATVLREFGVQRQVEAWGDDVPDGKVTDFKGAVQAKDGETVVFAWFEYPDRAARDAANAKMMSDPRTHELSVDLPFDGKRMIMGGFETLVDEGQGSTGGYTDGFLVAVPEEKRDAYRQVAVEAAAVFLDHGALRVVEAWSDDVPDGEVTDFRKSVKAKDGEKVVFSWIEWPSKEARVTGWERVMADARMKHDPANMPFDGKRMVYGGFLPIVDTARG